MQYNLFIKKTITKLFFLLLFFSTFSCLFTPKATSSVNDNISTVLKVKKRYSPLLNDDFLTICGFSGDDFKTLKYIYQNSNKNYIPSFEKIKNDDIKTALYIAVFNKIFSSLDLNQYTINIIGTENAFKIRKFIYPAIRNIINGDDITYTDVREYLRDRRLTSFDLLQIFKNRNFAKMIILNDEKNIIDSDFLKTAFFNAIGSNIVSKDDMLTYKQLYGDIFFDDSFILQQLRIRLWRKNLNNIDFIISLLKKKENIEKARTLVRFYNYRFLKKLKGRNNVKNQQQSLYNCNTFSGFDQYSDLVCITDNSKNKVLVKKIFNANKNPSFLPERWFTFRNDYIRDKITQNNVNYDDYDIIANSGILTGEKYYIQQFNAGFIAFLLKSYDYAIEHFSNSFDYATHTDEISKAGYWLAISYKKVNDYNNYNETIKKISEYPLTLYGQMALEDIGLNPEDEIVNLFNNNKLEVPKLCKNQIFIAGYMDQIFSAGVSTLLINFIDNYKDDKEVLFSALNVIENDFNDNISRGFAMYVKRYNVALPDSSYPIVNIEDDSLVNAIIQKESNFKIKAVSNKGARGVMQIIPSTGKRLAQHMGLEYRKDLLHHPAYNIKIGKFYLDSLLDRFKGHKILALSAYNAGPTNVDKWIAKYGDIRKTDDNDDVAIWIERIPFSQTRGYIIKVLGAEMVYDVLLKFQQNNKKD